METKGLITILLSLMTFGSISLLSQTDSMLKAIEDATTMSSSVEHFEPDDRTVLNSLKALSYKDPQAAFDKAFEIKERALEANDLHLLSHAWHEMAFSKAFLGESKWTIAYADTSYQIAVREKDRIGRLRALNTKAHGHYNLDQYTEAMACILEALEYAQDTKEDSIQMGISYRRMANINYRSNENDLMHQNLLKSYEMLKNTGDDLLLIGTIGSLAHSYRANNDLESAKPYYKQVLEIARRNELITHLGTTYDALRQIAKDEGNLEDALGYSEEAIGLYREMNSQMALCENLIRKAETLTDLKRYEEAQEVAEEAIALSKKMDHHRSFEMAYNIQSRIYEERGEYDQSLKYFKLFKTYNDSVNERRNIERYKNLEKQKEIDLQKIELTNLSKEEVQKTRERNMAYGGLSLVSIMGLLLGRRYLINKKLNRELVAKNDLIKSQKDELSEALEDKNILLREIHHRVKNNLQIISSLLNLQSKKISDETVLSSINEGRNRVQAMSLIHQNLYQTEHLTSLEMQNYFEQLMANLSNSLEIPDKEVRYVINARDVELDIDTAIPIGLIVNELVSNAYEHAFKGSDTGLISIDLRSGNDQSYTLMVSDNGVGIPDGFDFKKSKSLGLRLVYTLGVRQLKGELEFENYKKNSIILRFKDI